MERARYEYSSAKDTPFVSNRLALYASTVIFWICTACSLLCRAVIPRRAQSFPLSALTIIYLCGNIGWCGAIVFFPYSILAVALRESFMPQATSKVMHLRTTRWNHSDFRFYPGIFSVDLSRHFYEQTGVFSPLAAICYLLGNCNVGLLYDGMIISALCLLTLPIIIFFSAFAMMIRLYSLTFEIVCAPLTGKSSAILFYVLKSYSLSVRLGNI